MADLKTQELCLKGGREEVILVATVPLCSSKFFSNFEGNLYALNRNKWKIRLGTLYA